MSGAIPEETAAEATAEVFMTALKALPERTRERIFEQLAKEPELMEDLLDTAIIESRRSEPARPLEDVLKELQ
jgi:DNA-binding transcriptional ArsR family regulator